MIKDIIGLLKGDIGALVVDTVDGWLCSALCKDEVSHFTDEIQLLKKCISHEETVEKFIKSGGRISVVYWNPMDTICFDVFGEGITPIRKFPRRSNVRFILQDGKEYRLMGGFYGKE